MDRILSVGNKIELSKIKKNKDDDAVTYVSQILDMKDEKIVAAATIFSSFISRIWLTYVTASSSLFFLILLNSILFPTLKILSISISIFHFS